MSRKSFWDSLNLKYKNQTWSWSAINQEANFVVFGAFGFQPGDTEVLIFSLDWERNDKKRKNSGFEESLNNIELVERHSMELFIFPQIDIRKPGEPDPAKMRIGEEKLHHSSLVRKGRNWFAIPTDHDPLDQLDQVEERVRYFEGERRMTKSWVLERDFRARIKCIEIHGCRCCVCGFDFEASFGEIGRGFIHVHHLNPLTGTGPVNTDPAIDLVPLCPNCHSMAHKRNPPIPVVELQKILARNSKSDG